MSDTAPTPPLATMHIGPLGSTLHVLRADPETIAALATVDWNRSFGRVCLDSVRGLVALMAPSLLHDELAGMVEDIVQVAGSILTGAFKGLRSTRLRGRGDPPGTGMEPDCAFYFGERARRFREALMEGIEVADAFVERNAPDLVVEVEITNADEGKIERYGEIGVRELWRLYGHKDTKELRAEFLALRSGHAPRALAASEVLQGGAHTRRPVRGGGRSAACPHPRRADGDGRPDRAPAAERQRAGARGGGAVRAALRVSGTGCLVAEKPTLRDVDPCVCRPGIRH